MHPALRRLLPPALGSIVLAVTLAGPAVAGVGATLYVDDDGKVGPNGCTGTSIDRGELQQAVDEAAPGDTIRVCPGTYLGFVTITKNDLTLEAVDPYTAVVTQLVLTGRQRPAGPSVPSALVLIQGADRVTVRKLRFVAPAPAIAPAGPGCQIGAMVAAINDADGARILGNRMGTSGPDTIGGCGYLDGVAFVGGSSGRAVGNTITNFAGVAIRAADAGTKVLADANTIRFWHKQESYSDIGTAGTGFFCSYGAGVTFEYGAGGTITDNQVQGLATAGSTTPLICPGIYLNDAADGIKVLRNRIVNAFDGINTSVTDAWILKGNRIIDSRNEGILTPGSRRGLAETNTVSGSLSHGIVVPADMAPIAGSVGYGDLSTAGGGIARNNIFRDNRSTDNAGRDCLDLTTGTRSKGTANTWTGNHSDGNDRPNGLCPLS